MLQQLKEQGYFIAKNLVNVDEQVIEMCQHFPKSDPDPVQDFGSGGKALFPSTHGLNQINDSDLKL
tara:strand:- start:610 stop:807 length:198 start_codon:yes stop_codon:yes gene_type:complete